MARSQDNHTELIQKLTAQLKQARKERDALLKVCMAIIYNGGIMEFMAVHNGDLWDEVHAAIALTKKGE